MKTHKGIVLVPSDFDGVDWLEKMKSAGLDTLGLHSGGGPAHNVYDKLEFMGDDAFRTKMASAGLDWEYELHASDMFIDHSLVNEKPDIFPKNVRKREIIANGNWCISSDEAQRMIRENAKEMTRRLPSSTKRYFYWGADSISEGWCHCPKCQSLTAADQALLTANIIAEAIQDVVPGAQVAFLAYHSTLEVPENVKPSEHVFLEYAPFFRCDFHAITDNSCAENRRHRRILEGLLELFSAERTHILEYWLDSSHYGYTCPTPQKPVFIPSVVEEDVRYYTSLGIKSITTFGVRMNGEYFSLYGDRELYQYGEILGKYLG